jgi:hypothetical protein
MKTTIANPVNTTNAMGKKRKRPKNIHKSKKDEENILSKDIEDDNIRYMMDTKKNLKPREDLKSSFTLKNLRFKPQKYKGSYLPYHLRWIFNNNVKSNEIVLLNEIEGLENEINRLKILKLVNRECRKLAGLPFGVTTNFCQCCHLFEKKKHDCSHKFCNENCPRKKIEESMNNLLKNYKIKDFKDNGNGNIPKDKNIKKIFDETNNNNINNKNVKNNYSFSQNRKNKDKKSKEKNSKNNFPNFSNKKPEDNALKTEIIRKNLNQKRVMPMNSFHILSKTKEILNSINDNESINLDFMNTSFNKKLSDDTKENILKLKNPKKKIPERKREKKK